MAIDVQTVLEAFDPSLFLPKLTGKTIDAVLREMIVPVCSQGLVREADLLFEMLRSREQLGSTGIGNGIAVPHGRSLAIPRLTAVFGRHPRGVNWHAVDSKPVKIVFLILAPPLEQHSRYLPFLGRIVESVSDAKRRAVLARVSTYEKFQENLRDALA